MKKKKTPAGGGMGESGKEQEVQQQYVSRHDEKRDDRKRDMNELIERKRKKQDEG